MHQCHILWLGALALVASFVLSAQPTHAARLEVNDEGNRTFYIGLVIEPGESVAGVQIAIHAAHGTITDCEAAQWSVPVTLNGELLEVPVDPWFNSFVGFCPGLSARGSFRTNPPSPALTSDMPANVDAALGPFAALRDPSFSPTSVPLARVVVSQGEVRAEFEGCDPPSACGFDVDNDGIDDRRDNCPGLSNPNQADTDDDDTGDACNDAFDADDDEWADALDSCPNDPNPDQADTDGDGVGDACNDGDDLDGDEWSDVLDNCPTDSNPLQEDVDADVVGDICDPFPTDPDNEQAQCEQDLGICVIHGDQCNTDLIAANAGLDACQADLAVAGDDLAMCDLDLSTLMLILEPENLLETTGMGSPGTLDATFSLKKGVFVGARFEVMEELPVGSVGAHLVLNGSGKPGEIFAAIVELDGPADYPDSFDLSTPDVVGVTRLPIPASSNEIVAPLPLSLAPGWHGLVLGSGLFGATGKGGVTLNNVDIGPRSMFAAFATGWEEVDFPARLVVTRKSPELLACTSDLGDCQQVVIDGNGDLDANGIFDLVDTVIGRRVLAGEPVP